MDFSIFTVVQPLPQSALEYFYSPKRKPNTLKSCHFPFSSFTTPTHSQLYATTNLLINIFIYIFLAFIQMELYNINMIQCVIRSGPSSQLPASYSLCRAPPTWSTGMWILFPLVSWSLKKYIFFS